MNLNWWMLTNHLIGCTTRNQVQMIPQVSENQMISQEKKNLLEFIKLQALVNTYFEQHFQYLVQPVSSS